MLYLIYNIMVNNDNNKKQTADQFSEVMQRVNNWILAPKNDTTAALS